MNSNFEIMHMVGQAKQCVGKAYEMLSAQKGKIVGSVLRVSRAKTTRSARKRCWIS